MVGLPAAQALPVGTNPRSVAAADLDGDGKPDLAVASFNTNEVGVLLGNGNGTFAAAVNYAVGSSPYAVAAADLNGDGEPDLAVANIGHVSALLNQGNGTFATATTYPGDLDSLTAADLNGDGRADLVGATSFANIVSVMLTTCLP